MPYERYAYYHNLIDSAIADRDRFNKLPIRSDFAEIDFAMDMIRTSATHGIIFQAPYCCKFDISNIESAIVDLRHELCLLMKSYPAINLEALCREAFRPGRVEYQLSIDSDYLE